MRGAVNRLKREHNERAWLAWHIVALARTKKLPKMKALLHDADGPKRRQTVEEQIAIARAWTAAVNRKR